MCIKDVKNQHITLDSEENKIEDKTKENNSENRTNKSKRLDLVKPATHNMNEMSLQE